MYSARLILGLLLFLSTLAGAKPGFALEDSPSMAPKAGNSPALQTSQTSNVLGLIAIALPGGSEAMRTLRGSPYENDQRDRLEPPLPGMNCGIDRVLSYVSCYSAPIDNETEAVEVFNKLVENLRAALPSDRWRPVSVVPTLGSIRIVSYQERQSAAQVDIELLVGPTVEVQRAYVISLYGWARL
jgi:hypothetical protein